MRRETSGSGDSGKPQEGRPRKARTPEQELTAKLNRLKSEGADTQRGEALRRHGRHPGRRPE